MANSLAVDMVVAKLMLLDEAKRIRIQELQAQVSALETNVEQYKNVIKKHIEAMQQHDDLALEIQRVLKEKGMWRDE